MSLVQHGPGIDYEFYRNKLNGVTDYDIDIDYNFRFRSQSSFTLKTNILYTKLLTDFDPSRSDGVALEAFSEYNYVNHTFWLRTSERKIFSARLNAKNGLKNLTYVSVFFLGVLGLIFIQLLFSFDYFVIFFTAFVCLGLFYIWFAFIKQIQNRVFSIQKPTL